MNPFKLVIDFLKWFEGLKLVSKLISSLLILSIVSVGAGVYLSRHFMQTSADWKKKYEDQVVVTKVQQINFDRREDSIMRAYQRELKNVQVEKDNIIQNALNEMKASKEKAEKQVEDFLKNSRR